MAQGMGKLSGPVVFIRVSTGPFTVGLGASVSVQLGLGIDLLCVRIGLPIPVVLGQGVTFPTVRFANQPTK